MKIAIMKSYCLHFFALFLLCLCAGNAEAIHEKSPPAAYSPASTPSGAILTTPVRFQYLNNTTYNWTMQSLSANKSVNSLASDAFAVSTNRITDTDDGSLLFYVTDLVSMKHIGFSEVDVLSQPEDLKAYIRQDAAGFYLFVDDTEILELSPVSIGSKIQLEYSGGDINAYLDDELVGTESITWSGGNIYIGAVMGSASAQYVNLLTDFPDPFPLDGIATVTEDFDRKGAVDFSITNGAVAHVTWENAQFLSSADFTTNSTALGGDLDFDSYQTSFGTSRKDMDHGTYQATVIESGGEILKTTIDIPSGQRYVADDNVTQVDNSFSKSGGGNNWSTGFAMSDNVMHPEYNGKAFFKFDQSGTAAVGFRPLNVPYAEDYSGMSYGLYLQGDQLTPVVGGELFPDQGIQYSRESFLGIEFYNGEVHFQLNGATFYRVEGELTHKNTFEVHMFDLNTRFFDMFFIGLPRWPINTYEQTNSLCGKITQNFSLKNIGVLLPADAHVINYIWRDADGNTVATGMDLDDVQPGVYTLHYSVQYSNGQGQSYISPTSYIVGYKAFWETTVQVEHVPVTHAIRNTLESFNNNVHTGVTSNYLNPGVDEWVYFEIQDPVDLNGNVLYPGYYNRNYKLSLQSYSGVAHLTAIVHYIGGSTATLQILDANGTNLFTSGVNDGDRVWMQIQGGNQLKVDLNGQNLTSNLGGTTASFSGIQTPSIIGFGTSFMNASVFDTKIGPSKVISSFPCADMTYLNLKRKVDGSYYPARLNAIGFRYVEDYLPANGLLNYRILDRNNEDVFAANNTALPDVLREVGDNKCEIDLSSYRNFLPAGYYILEVTDDKNQLRFIRFRLY